MFKNEAEVIEAAKNVVRTYTKDQRASPLREVEMSITLSLLTKAVNALKKEE